MGLKTLSRKFEMYHRQEGSTCIIKLKGTLDIQVAGLFASAVEDLVDGLEPTKVILDFEQLVEIDSDGAAHLFDLMERSEWDVEFTLGNVPAWAQQTIDEFAETDKSEELSA